MEQTPKKPGATRPFDAYRRTDVMTASKESILLMLYAGLVRFMKQAMEAGERGDAEERARLIGRSQEILTELRSTLNFEVGGELPRQLDSLYAFISQRLAQANTAQDSSIMLEAIEIISTLYRGWEEAIAALRKK